MNITRTVSRVEIEIPTIDSVQEASDVRAYLESTPDLPKNKRDAANSLIEGFFVTHLRNVPAGSLSTELHSLTYTWGNWNAYNRAVARVSEFRGRNRAFN